MENEKALSEKPLGYVIAALCGVLGGPLGIAASPLALFAITQSVKKDAEPKGLRWILWGAIGIPVVPILIVVTNLSIVAMAPVVFNESDKANRMAADSVVASAARQCAALIITEDLESFMPSELVTGSCEITGGKFTSKVEGLRKQAIAVTDQNGLISLPQKAE